MTGYRHAPSRLPMNKLKSLLQKTRKVTFFVWKSIRKNTPLSSEIHCYVKRTNCNSARFLPLNDPKFFVESATDILLADYSQKDKYLNVMTESLQVA